METDTHFAVSLMGKRGPFSARRAPGLCRPCLPVSEPGQGSDGLGLEHRMAARAVCVSRTLAANGEDVARAVAGRLGFRVVDAEVIQTAAERAGVDPGRIQDIEQREPLLRRLLATLRLPDPGGDQGYQRETMLSEAASASGRATEERLRQTIKAAIEAIASEGRVVVVAHAASMALGGREDVLRVLVTGSAATRARRLVQLSGASLAEARRAVADSDRARAAYLQRFYGVPQELPTHYDVVVNTDLLTPERAVELIVAAAR